MHCRKTLVRPWVYPRSARVFRRPSALVPAMNSAAYSALVAALTTDLMIVDEQSIAPLKTSGLLASSRLTSAKMSAARERACSSERYYEASECPTRIISDAW